MNNNNKVRSKTSNERKEKISNGIDKNKENKKRSSSNNKNNDSNISNGNNDIKNIPLKIINENSNEESNNTTKNK